VAEAQAKSSIAVESFMIVIAAMWQLAMLIVNCGIVCVVAEPRDDDDDSILLVTFTKCVW
jgi:hypothetical protein